jgi:hypothetical protein
LFKSVADFLRKHEDDERTLGDFIPLIPVRLQSFVKDGVRACVRNVLARIRVLSPSIPLDSLREDVNEEDALELISQAEVELDNLAHHIFERLEFPLPGDGDGADE